MAVLLQMLNEIRQVIKSNINCKDNLDGVLSRREVQYMACLELKHRELEDLFQQDEHQLAENIENSKRQADEVKAEIEALMEKQRQDLQAIFDRRKMLQSPKPKFKLRKLPIWGKNDTPINFEWPTQEIMDNSPWDVTLKSIMLASSSASDVGSVAFVQCALTHDVSSPLFSNKNENEKNSPKVINFDAGRRVRKVSAIFIDNYPRVYNVIFFDKDNSVIGGFNPL